MPVGVPGSYRHLPWRCTYTSDMVEALLPTLWGLQILDLNPEGERDRDGGATKLNHERDPDITAMIADARMAWEHAKLSIQMRQAIFLVHGYDLSQEAAAWFAGVSQQAMSLRISAGAALMTDYLNGVRYDY